MGDTAVNQWKSAPGGNLGDKKAGEQFSLSSVFYAISLLASGLALSTVTLFFSISVLLFWYIGFKASVKGKGTSCIMAIVLYITLLIGAGVSMFTVHTFRLGSKKTQCSGRMRQLCLALLIIESNKGQFPHPTSEGDFPHSWRIDALSKVEPTQFAKKYNRSEPWNGPKNSALGQIHVPILTCPVSDHDTKTPYKLVVGPGTVFDESAPPTISKITDGSANTIIMIEDHSNPIQWTSPHDISIDDAVDLICNMKPHDTSHYHVGIFETVYPGIQVGFADGSIGTIGFNADPTQVRRAFLCSDNQGVDYDVNSIGKIIRIRNWGGMVATAIYGFLIAAPAVPFYRRR